MGYLAVALVAPQAAEAAEPADQAYKTAMELANAGDLRAARAMFERAYAIAPQWRYAFNAGKTAALDNDLVASELWLWRAAQHATVASEVAKTQSERLVTEKQLVARGFARLTVRVAPAVATAVVTVDSEPMQARDTAWVLWTRAGRRKLRVDVAGCSGVGLDVVLAPQDDRELACNPCASGTPDPPAPKVKEGVLPAPAPAAKPVSDAHVPAETTGRTVPTTPVAPSGGPAGARPDPSTGGSNWVAATVGAAGVVALLAGAGAMSSAASDSAADNSAYLAGNLSLTAYQSQRRDLKTRYQIGAAGVALGGLGTALATWLWLRPASTAGPAVVVIPTDGGAVVVQWTF